MAKDEQQLIPVYTTSGDWAALISYPHIYNTLGEWIGWATSDRQVYDVDGIYVGWISDGPRILRKRYYEDPLPRMPPPSSPGRIRPPASVPLPATMPEMLFGIIDVLEEEPNRLHTIDTGELKEDMD